LGLLYLTDSALVASTVVMVAVSSDDSLVSRLKEQAATRQMHWPGGLDASDLKLKLATSIAPISSLHLLQIFLTPGSYDAEETMWALVIHATFLVGALHLGLLGPMSHKQGADTMSRDIKEVHDATSKEQRQEKV
jgi:uncharacterized protein (TIGR00645 family)